MKITAKQIAQQAGVSPATVSLVMNGRPGVSDEVRRRVMEIAQGSGTSCPPRPRWPTKYCSW